MLHTLAIENYRSIRQLILSLDQLNVITGPNGVGKSNLYRALRLLSRTARGGVGAALAEEGGLPSALWAGPEHISRAMRRGQVPVQGTVRRGPVRLRLGFCDDEFGYQVSFGLPVPTHTLFNRDPEIKSELIWIGQTLRPSSTLVERAGALIKVREGNTLKLATESASISDSLFTELVDPQRAPEVVALRQRIRSWRFYDALRTDWSAPARQPQLATRTPVLDHEGRDLASALQTILEVGDRERLFELIKRAFDGSKIEIESHEDGHLSLGLRQPGMLRSLDVRELSEGTLRFLMLCAALLTPRPPPVMVLNEPEGSLHPELLRPLGELIGHAGQKMQLWVITHSDPLLEALSGAKNLRRLSLTKEFGATTIASDSGDSERSPYWKWIE